MRAVRAARAVTCIALASALSVPALSAQADYFLKLGGVEGESRDDKHKNQIEILSWSWGASQPATSGGMGGGMGAGKVSMSGLSAAEGGEKGGTEDINIGVGEQSAKQGQPTAVSHDLRTNVIARTAQSAGAAAEGGEAARANDRLRTAGPRDGWPAAGAGEAEITLKGDAAAGGERKRPGKVKYGDITLKRGHSQGATAGGVSVAAGDLDGDGRAEAAQHKSGSLVYLNRNRQKELSVPASNGPGTLTLIVPAGMCKAGMRYPTAEVGTGARIYKLSDVAVTACSPASGGDRPMESISLNFTKVE